MTGSTLRRDAFLSVIVPVHEAVLTIEPLLRQLSAWTRSTERKTLSHLFNASAKRNRNSVS